MSSWKDFRELKPELAEFGKNRLKTGVAFLGTIRKDGFPRVHPVTPIISLKRLFIFMEPTSPKGNDLHRNNRYTLHSSVNDTEGSNGEFRISGYATLIEDRDIRKEAIEASSYSPKDRYILFELSIEQAGSTIYLNEKPKYENWKKEI
ncbi:MAG: pyridoxamine 5'-phosphate oxidase family protein [Candidatus Hodarchaeales archaeon]|jgi:hypothetical protein